MDLTDRPVAPDEDAVRRHDSLNGLIWHAGTFAIVNAGLWTADLMGRGTIDWAYLVTLPWTLALGFHAAAYWVGGTGLRNNKMLRFLR